MHALEQALNAAFFANQFNGFEGYEPVYTGLDQADVADLLGEKYATENDFEPDYDDSMDGDHASALASIGWGTDEDYGYYDDGDLGGEY